MFLFLPHRLQVYFARQDRLAKVLNLLGSFVAFCVLFALSLKVTEKITWNEAVWQVWQTVTTVGYGNQPAVTPKGRVATMLFGLGGIAFLGALISAYFDWRADKRERKRIGEMQNPFDNSYLVIHFPGVAKFTTLSHELASVEPKVEICVVDNQIESLPTSVTHIKGIRTHFVRGSLLVEETYKQAGVDKAKAVLVFPQQSGVPESDASTKMVTEIVGRLAPPTTRIAHVLVAPENEWLFKGGRSVSVLEIAEISILVQESQDPYSAVTLQSILRSSDGNTARTVAPVQTVGWTWGRLVRACLSAGENNECALHPLALIQDGTPNPCPSPHIPIQTGDRVSVIVRGNLDWERTETVLLRHDKAEPSGTAA
jgi:hypothetical protein